MKRCRSAVFLCALVLLGLLALTLPAFCASAIRDGDPGTIGACLTQPDGSRISLPAEQVIWRGRSGKSFAIKESFEREASKPRLVVVSTKPLPVEDYWSVDLEGVLSTFSGISKDGNAFSQRVLIVSPQNVYVYCDAKGRPFIFPPVKGLGIEWPNKRSIAELSSTSTIGTANVSTMDAGSFPLMDDSPDSEPTPPAPGSRDSLKWLPDGVPVSVNGAIVSAAFDGFFYVEKSDRSFGIWISSQDYVSEGQLLDIAGRMGTGGGERAVIADQGGVSILDYNTYPRPTEVGMPNKALGGGAVGLFTPPVSDAVGLNNTGLLVRAWGKVTFVDTQNRIFYVDDGSGVTADSGRVGVKVYDMTTDTLPTVNSYQTLSGVSAVEWPQGASESIRVVWKISPVTRYTQPGSGTISGTITATGADGKTVKVYCGSASTTATFSGNTANYTLSVPYGSHAVTSSIIGYKTTTQPATVNSGTPVDLDFTLPALQRRIDVVPLQGIIAPDGVSETTVIAIVRDEEGRRYGDESITWNIDAGSLISSDSMTNAVGEATAVIRSSTLHETATVSVQVGSTVGLGWVMYGSAGDPSVWPVTPVYGETLSGGVYIEYSLYDPDGDVSNLCSIEVFVDGQSIGFISWANPKAYWETFTATNGTHTIRVQVTDSNGNTMWSPATVVQTDNYIHGLNATPAEFDPGIGQQATISASLKESVNWQLTIQDTSGSNTVYTTTGSGNTVSCAWNGSTSLTEDLFQYTIEATSGSHSGTLAKGWVGKKVIPDNQIQVLSVAGPNLRWWPLYICRIYDYAKERGFRVKKLPPRAATWSRVSSILSNGNCRMLYVDSHGTYAEIRPGYWRTVFQLDRLVLSYPVPGTPFQAVSTLGLEDSEQMRFVWIDACYSGYSGTSSGENDMAKAFGMYNDWNMMMGDQAYVGWKNKSEDDNSTYMEWCWELFYNWRVSGRTLERAEFLTYWNNWGFDYIYNNNIANYGGDYNMSYYTTFFDVY